MAEWTYSGFTRVEWCCIVYRLPVDPDITSVVLRRTRYSALVYVTEKRRIGHTVAPILEVEHRWYRHQRSAAETVTDIPAECTSSSTPGKFAKLFCPFPSNRRREHSCIISCFFFAFRYQRQRIKTNSLSSEGSNCDKVQMRIVRKHIFIFHLAIRTFVS